MSLNKVKKPKKRNRLADLVKKLPESITDTRRNDKKYIFGKFIGAGSFAKVFELIEVESGKKFACKVLSRETDLNVICNEIEIINKLQHRNIFELVGIVHDPKFVYLIQSYYINGTLKHLLKHRRIISIAECRYFIHQILCGTQYIHSKNIIHRDLKLANIFIDEHMQLKIGDFGLAINITDVEADRYHICGTIRYLSPEVLNHNGFSFESDVWAIGVMMYNLIVGTSPFDGDNVKMTAKLIRKMNYSLPDNMDAEAAIMIKDIFKEITDRPNVTQCLRMKFIANDSLPIMLPTSNTMLHIGSADRKSNSESLIIISLSCESQNESNSFENNNIPIFDNKVREEFSLNGSPKNSKYAEVIKRIYQIFNTLCQNHDPNKIPNQSGLKDEPGLRPEFWIKKCLFNKEIKIAIGYQLNDKTFGVLFRDGVKMARSPLKRVYQTESLAAHLIPERIEIFETLCKDIEEMTETELNGEQLPFPNNIPFLHTWFRTKDIIVLLLTNRTIQVDFLQSNRKIVIHPTNAAISFIKTNEDDTEQVTTIKMAKLIATGFGAISLLHFEHLTDLFKYLYEKLSAATAEIECE